MNALTRPWTPEMKERAIRNVAWVRANMQSIIAMAAPRRRLLAQSCVGQFKNARDYDDQGPQSPAPDKRRMTTANPSAQSWPEPCKHG